MRATVILAGRAVLCKKQEKCRGLWGRHNPRQCRGVWARHRPTSFVPVPQGNAEELPRVVLLARGRHWAISSASR
ncbi:hypothetical protein PIB30_028417 [Stylosanthes scabra]|uniref:Uncharacterized protein n=1 Tax=Stylosanthes scabra TaxID=79078 RepID=A0ABU6VD68_9FABA|nr:hypothetical protein [Stylosanthes scabra]